MARVIEAHDRARGRRWVVTAAADVPPPDWTGLWEYLDAWHAEQPKPDQRPEEER